MLCGVCSVLLMCLCVVCNLSIVVWLFVRCSLFVVRCVLFLGCKLLLVVCCVLCVVWCCCLLFVVVNGLIIAGCLLIADC